MYLLGVSLACAMRNNTVRFLRRKFCELCNTIGLPEVDTYLLWLLGNGHRELLRLCQGGMAE